MTHLPLLILALTQHTGLKNVVLVYDQHKVGNIEFIPWDWLGYPITLEEYPLHNFSTNEVNHFLDRTCDVTREPKLFFVLCQSRCIMEVLQQANLHETRFDQQGVFTYRDRWVLVTEHRPLKFDSFLGNLNNVLFADVNHNIFQFNTVSWFTKRSRSRSYIVINCPVQWPLQCPYDLFPSVNYGLNSRHFTISTNLWFTYVEKSSQAGCYTGISMELLSALAKKMNFTYTVILPPDGKWGGVENGSWNGLIGQLQRKEVDMVVAPIGRNWKREQVIDCTTAYSRAYYTALYRKGLPDNKTAMGKSLHWVVLLCFGAAILAVTLLLIAGETLLTPKHFKLNPSSVINLLISVFGMSVLQGVNYIPSSWFCRLLWASWWFVSLIVMSTYTGNLMAAFTVDTTRIPFRSLSDLADSDTYKVGTLGDTVMEASLKYSSSGVYARLWEKIHNIYKQDKDVLNPNNNIHMKKVRREDYAYLTDWSEAVSAMANDCSLSIIEEKFRPNDYVVGLQNNSVYKDIVSSIILQLHDMGVMKKWHMQYTPDVACGGTVGTKGKTLTLEDLYGVFLGLAALTLGAATILGLEVVYNSHQRTISSTS